MSHDEHRKRSTSLEEGNGESRGRPLGGWSDHWHKKKRYSRKERNNDAFESNLVTGEYASSIEASKREQNKGSHGVDMMPVQILRQHILKNWSSIKEAILVGTYEPMPVRRVEIPKPDGGIRLLGIPTVTDRLIQQAIAQVLSKIYDQMFSEHSYGFRPNRSAHDAVRKAKGYIQEGYRWVVDMDLEKFFDKVNHDRLMSTLAKRINDKPLLKLVRKYLQAGVMINGVVSSTEEGTPQGGPLSPLLSNIVLDELDKELEERGHKFVRYADDCVPRRQTKCA